MPKVIIVFGSMSGNTEEIARLIKKRIQQVPSVEVQMADMFDIEPSSLLEYEGIILGSYSWGMGNSQKSVWTFMRSLKPPCFMEKKAAVFGSDDTSYPHFCGAVDILFNALVKCKVEMIEPPLKVGLDPVGEDRERSIAFGNHFAVQLLNERAKYML